MAYRDDCTRDMWHKDARESVSEINRLMKHGKDDLVYTIMRGECWDDLEELIRVALQMKSLLLKAETTFSNNMEEETKETEQHEEVMGTLEAIRKKICNVDNCVGASLGETVKEAVKLEVTEIRESTNTIVGYIFEKEQTDSRDDLPSLPKPQKTKDRRYNVMAFLPGGTDSRSYSRQIGKMLTYIGCDKESMTGIEVVRDNEDFDKRTVLRVHMDSIEQASKIIANAYKLKRYNDLDIYVAKDLNFRERIKLRELVRILREKICEDPSHRWKIIDWQVVKVGLFKSCKKQMEYEINCIDDSSCDTDESEEDLYPLIQSEVRLIH